MPAGDRKIAKLFLQCTMYIVKLPKYWSDYKKSHIFLEKECSVRITMTKCVSTLSPLRYSIGWIKTRIVKEEHVFAVVGIGSSGCRRLAPYLSSFQKGFQNAYSFSPWFFRTLNTHVACLFELVCFQYFEILFLQRYRSDLLHFRADWAV